MSQILTIPYWLPTTRKLKQSDADTIARLARQQDLTSAYGPRLVGLILRLSPRHRVRDPDASLKSLLGALVNCGMLTDDTPGFCYLGNVQQELRAKNWGTTIVLKEWL